MEALASSRHVIRGAHALAYFCKLCRAEMPFEQREFHNRGIHPDLFERQQRAYARNMRIVITAVVGSGVGFFLGLFVPAAMLGIHVPVWYLIAIFIAMCAGISFHFPSSRKRGALISRTSGASSFHVLSAPRSSANGTCGLMSPPRIPRNSHTFAALFGWCEYLQTEYCCTESSRPLSSPCLV